MPWLAFIGSFAAAAEPSPNQAGTASSLRYRKVFVPAEAIRNLESNAVQDEAFVPLRREEFDQLLGAVGAIFSAPQAASSSRVVQAAYTAILDGELLLGTAQLNVSQPTDPTAVLSLEPCNLVISAPAWRPDTEAKAAAAAAAPPAAESTSRGANAEAGPNAAGASAQTVELGCDDAGQLVALVNTSGVLQFDWSRRGAKNSAGELVFALRLPNATVNQLRLTVPSDVRPVADAAMISPLPESAGASAQRSWLIEARSDAELTIRLVPAAAAPLAEPLMLLRQEHRYACSLEAADVAVRLRLDIHQTPLSELTLELDDALQLVRAYYRDSPLDWSESKAGAKRQVTLALPEPLLGDGHEIRLQAISSAEVGTAWRLPRVHVPGVFWVEGVSRLEVPEPLWVAHLDTDGCRQVLAAPLLAPLRGESLEIRDFQPQPKIVAILQRHAGEAVAQTVTRVKLGTAAADLEYHAELTCSGPPRYDLALAVLPGWMVDMVEAQPPDALEDWQVAFRSGQSRTIDIHLRRPLSAEQPIRLTLHAHRRGVRPGERWRGRELRLGALRDTTVTRSVIAVVADASHQLALSGDAGVRRLATEDLSSWEKDCFQSAVGAVTFLDGETTDEVSLDLLGETPGYSADVHIDAAYSERWVEQAFRLRCQPIASTVARLVVHVSEPLTTPLRWTLSDEEGTVLTRAMVADAESVGESSPGSHSWEIILPRPRADAFELLATRSDAFSETATVPLVSLPAAASQAGYVTVRSATLPLAIDVRNVRPIPAEPPPPDRFSTTRGAFRYDPSLDCRLSVRIAEGPPGLGAAWVRNCRLSTSVLGGGRALHTAVCLVENRGRTQVLVVPPAGAELLDLLVDGKPYFWPRQATTQAGVTVNLPSGERFPTLVVRFTTLCSRRGPLATVVAPWPNLGMPIFQRQWAVGLPPGWEVESSQAADGGDWISRLFGPVLRSSRQPRFDPLSARHWASLAALTDPRGDSADAGAKPSALPATSPPTYRDGDVPNQGWTAAQVRLSAGANPAMASFRETRVRIVHRDFFRAAGWAALLAAAGLTAWGTRRRPVWCLPVAALWGCLALFCPATWAPVASGCFLGSLLAVLLVWQFPSPARQQIAESSRAPSSSRIVLSSTRTAISVLLMVLLLTADAIAQGAPAPPPAVPPPSEAPADKVYRVLFPVDDEQQPAEPYVYVPREFCDRLRREASGGGVVSRQWLIAGAGYRVVFDREAADPSLLARELVALYRVRTSRAGVRLILPIRQDQVYLLPNRARLDGQPASVAWESEGALLVVEIPEAGEADLELAFRPQVERREGLLRCEVLIPRVPNAQLRLQLPNDAPDVECPSVLGPTTTEATGERVLALGPADRLVLQWPTAAAATAGPPPVESEELLWLRIRPGAVVLQAKVRFRSAGGRLPEVSLLASPQLRLLPHDESGLIPVTSLNSGQDQRIRWKLKSPPAQEVALNLEFILADTSGIGSVRIPRLEAIADRNTRRWLGVSVDEALSYEVPAEGRGEAVDAAAFAAAWEAGAVPPQLAVVVPGGEPAWSLSTRPNEVPLKAAQQLNVAWGAERVDLRMEAQLETVGGGVFEYRLDVPAGLDIGGVTLRERDDARPLQWSRLDKSTVGVRVDRPASGPHQLELRASLPLARGPEQLLGKLGVRGAEIVSDAVAVYRRPSVRVSVADPAGLAPVAGTSVGQYQPGWGRLVAALQAAPNQPRTQPLRFSVTPNRPRTQGTLVTALDRGQDAWRVQVQYDLRVSSGVVDTLRWEVPADWSGAFECDCPGDLEVISVPGQKRRHLVLRPQQPIAASRRLCISGKLPTPQGEAVQAPDVIPLDVDVADRYLCAPTQINQQGIAWKTSGLREIAGLPAGFEPPSGPHKTYFVTQPRCQATIEDVQPSSGRPRVVLADLDVMCTADGELTGTATFDLQPSGAASCELELPEGCQLVNVAVAELPAMLESLGAQRWRVTLGPRQLAQQIQVIYQGRWTAVRSQAGPQTIRPPQLVGIPVERTLWTVGTADSAGLDIFPAQDRVAVPALEFVRFASRAGVIEHASEALAASDPEIAARWYSAWRRRLAASRRAIDQWSATHPEVRSRYAAELKDVEARQAELDQKLKSLPQLPPMAPEPSSPSDPAGAGTAADSQAGSAVAAVVAGDAPIQVGIRPTPGLSEHQRGAAAAVLLALAALAWLLLPHPVLHRWGYLLLPALGVALGGVWWYWCAPSAAGLAVGLVSLLVGLQRLLSGLPVPAPTPAPSSSDAG